MNPAELLGGAGLWGGVAVALFFLLLLVAEAIRPLRLRRTVPRVTRLWINGCMAAAGLVILRFLVLPPALAAAAWAESRGFGLVQSLAGLPRWAAWGTGLVAMDWSFYWWHRANHTFPLLWRFHNVHHTDLDLDASTAVRFHPGELGLSSIFRFVQVVVIGPPAALYLLFEGVLQMATLFHHSNVRLPLGVERTLNTLVVTPRMHGIHHSTARDETDSNFGTILAFWDRLHGSLRLGVPQQEIDIGVPSYRDPAELGLSGLLALPFAPARRWLYPDGSVPLPHAGGSGRRLAP